MDGQEKVRLLSEITIVELVEEDYPSISRLITGMTGVGFEDSELHLRDKSAAYYRWMYLANPVGKAVVVGAKHNDRLVASFAIAPRRMHFAERELVVGKTMDMFTDPEYQGLGLMSRTAGAAFQAAATRGLTAFLVTPSAMSYPIFMKKFGYREDFEVLYRAKILRPGKLLAWKMSKLPVVGQAVGVVVDSLARLPGLRPRRPLPSGYTAETDASFGDAEEALWRNAARDYGVATVRTAEYLTWRYVEHPDDYVVIKLKSQGELVGFIVLKETRRRRMQIGEIVDYVCRRDDMRTFRLLVRLALSYFRRRSAVICEAWAIAGSRQERNFIEAGIRFRRAAVKLVFSPDFPLPEPPDNELWMLAQGDGNDV